ncbi:MAG TPA: amidohydrolase family protein [Bryobacteraceae bacterium]|nr:amidohydrolase family protein [Bryobacteraceae bacterium]
MRLSALLFCLLLPLPAATYAIENVSVLPMDRERVLDQQTVLVKDNRIVEIGGAGRVKVPADATRIDGKGKFLIPGIAEMHGHLLPAQASAQEVDDVLFLYLANGVTLVRVMLGGPHSVTLRDEVASGKRLGPTLIVAGPALSGQSAPDPETAMRMVREQKQGGFNHIKVQEGLKRDTYDALAKTAKENSIPFAGHIPADVGVWHAVESGQSTIDHLDDYVEAIEKKEQNIPKLVSTLKKANVYSVPTMALWETFWLVQPMDQLRSRSELQYMPAALVNNWAASIEKRRSTFQPEEGKELIALRNKILKALSDGGAPIIFGTDSPQLFSVPGFSIHREMDAMKRAGLTNYQILASATRSPAEYYKTRDFGTVAPGRRADLLLLDANPLQDLANTQKVAGVMVRGQWIPKEQIQTKLADMAKRNAR